jgi:uncharacterized membrane protein YqjE
MFIFILTLNVTKFSNQLIRILMMTAITTKMTMMMLMTTMIIIIIQCFCAANCMELSISKTQVISFSRETVLFIYEHKLHQFCISRTDSSKTSISVF